MTALAVASGGLASAAGLWLAQGPASASVAANVDTSKAYELIARHSGKALDVYDRSTADAAVVDQWTVTSQTNQQWRFIADGGGYYEVRSVNSGKDLDDYQWSQTNGASVRQYSPNGGINQQWQVQDNGDGYLTLVNRNSGKALDVSGASTAVGAAVIQWPSSGSPNQEWQLVPAGTTPGPPTSTPTPTSTATPTSTPTSTSTPPSSSTGSGSGPLVSGFATYYGDAQPGGACMTQSLPPSHYTAAISHVDWAGSSLCQAYLSVTGPKGTILVKVDNECPDADCPTGHLDLSTEAFAAIGQLSQGVIPITWHIVYNPAITGDVLMTVQSGSSQYWLGLHIDNTGNAIATVQMAAAGSNTFTSMTRSTSGFFTSTTAPGPGPYRIRVTDVVGHTITASGISPQVGLIQNTGLRMY